MSKKLAIVMIRSEVSVNPDVRETIKNLRLLNKNSCSVWDATPTIVGMAKKVKDYVAYGYIDEDTFNKLVDKRGEIYKGHEKDYSKKQRYFVKGDKKYKKFFRLSPPKKGFERKGIKKGFNQGGAVGYRGDKMKDLILRMI